MPRIEAISHKEGRLKFENKNITPHSKRKKILMSIRLNKAIRELNIGLQTAVEFLEKRQELGEVKGDPNFKLSDDQFKALEKEFKTDQAVKNDAAKIFQKKQKDKVRTKKDDRAKGGNNY